SSREAAETAPVAFQGMEQPASGYLPGGRWLGGPDRHRLPERPIVPPSPCSPTDATGAQRGNGGCPKLGALHRHSPKPSFSHLVKRPPIEPGPGALPIGRFPCRSPPP